MDGSKWRRRFVFCQGAYLAVYQFYSHADSCSEDCLVDVDEDGSNEGQEDRDVVLLIAGCANSVAIYSMLGDASLSDYLYRNNYDVWAMDCRGHGESEPPPGPRQWDIGTYSFLDVNTVSSEQLVLDNVRVSMSMSVYICVRVCTCVRRCIFMIVHKSSPY